jgi:hypothetical protein
LASWLISEIAEFEKEQEKKDMESGVIPDIKGYNKQLLVQEAEFFIKKRDDLVAENEKLLFEKNELDKTKTDALGLRDVQNKINANLLSIKFFEKQICVVIHDMKILADGRKRVCYFLQNEQWNMEKFREFLKLSSEAQKQKALA